MIGEARAYFRRAMDGACEISARAFTGGGQMRGRGLLLFLITASLACGGKAAVDPRGDGGSVPECEAYATQLGACLGRDGPAAKHAAAQAASLAVADDAQRARMKVVCTRDLERLKTSCH